MCDGTEFVADGMCACVAVFHGSFADYTDKKSVFLVPDVSVTTEKLLMFAFNGGVDVLVSVWV